MDAARCLSCGETRWCLTSAAFARLLAEPCTACGGELVVERRRPGTAPRRQFIERRNLGTLPTAPPLVGAGARAPSEDVS
jgi:hypothetical protein